MKTRLLSLVAAAFRRTAVIGDRVTRKFDPVAANSAESINRQRRPKKGKAGQQPDRRITSGKSAWRMRMKELATSSRKGIQSCKIEIVRANDGP